MTRIVVTGGAGFIGANVARVLLGSGWVDEVTVVDDLSTGRAENLEGLDGAQLRIGSVTDTELLAGTIPGAAAIVHLAAQASVPRSMEDPVTTHDVNATGTLRVLDAARRAGGVHTIVASSAAVYGTDPTPVKHERLAPAPVSPYAVSKLATEAYATAYGAAYGVPTLALRFFNVFGPLQPADHVYAAAVPAFISAALADRPLVVHGDGHQTRDLVYVADVADVIVDAIRRQVTSPSPVNLAGGTPRRLLDVIASLELVLGRPLSVEHTAPRPGDIRHSRADQHLLDRSFPDRTSVPFETALRETVEWFTSGAHPGNDATEAPFGLLAATGGRA